jgi:hypothetical protein
VGSENAGERAWAGCCHPCSSKLLCFALRIHELLIVLSHSVIHSQNNLQVHVSLVWVTNVDAIRDKRFKPWLNTNFNTALHDAQADFFAPASATVTGNACLPLASGQRIVVHKLECAAWFKWYSSSPKRLLPQSMRGS